MRSQRIIFLLLMALGLYLCYIQQAKGQTIRKQIHFRVFGYNLVLATENSQIRGYYYNARGWPDKKTGAYPFTCLFLIKGELKSDKRYDITAFWVFDNEKIKGEIVFVGGAVWLKLDEDPPGCGNVEPFSFTEGVTFEETENFEEKEKTNWIGIGVVIREKTYFYKLPKQQKTRKYLVLNDIVYILNTRNEWVEVEFRGNGLTTRGWIKKGDLFLLEFPFA